MLTPQQFVQFWQRSDVTERANYQTHFNQVCELVGHPKPGDGEIEVQLFGFEKALKKEDGRQGYADVWYRGHFAIEYKSPDKDLARAYNQLKQYREQLHNPYILMVCDFQRWEIYSNFPDADNWKRVFTQDDLLDPNSELLRILKAAFFNPLSLDPKRTKDQVTEETAKSLYSVAQALEEQSLLKPEVALTAEQRAIFLTRLMFSLFAEDIGILPIEEASQLGAFSFIVQKSRKNADLFATEIRRLFHAMEVGEETLVAQIPYFNGALFKDIDIEYLPPTAIERLYEACRLNWSNINPTIFGTLFERWLDPGKRTQLGAHYTSQSDIELIVLPVLMQPLLKNWADLAPQITAALQRYQKAQTSQAKSEAKSYLAALRQQALTPVRSIKVIDPACGSGNFLYVALRHLLDLEKVIVNDPAWAILEAEWPQVHPKQVYGIEKDPIAHALASIVVWIGYLQWRIENGYPVRNDPDRPILEDLEGQILCMDAIMTPDGLEPEWQPADVVIGNPPFIGGNSVRDELGDAYINRLFELYRGRIPPFADLVCYWFEKARAYIQQGQVKRAGLLATNSIRGGVNREVLKRIKQTGDIFMAWSDRKWELPGASVRISMIGFDDGSQTNKLLDNQSVTAIHPDLTSDVDLTIAEVLAENNHISFMGPSPKGQFDIPESLAKTFIASDSRNAQVVRPVVSGIDLVGVNRRKWTIDFGLREEIDAAKYRLPFEYVLKFVYPVRSRNRRPAYAKNWWQYAEARPGMRAVLQGKTRFIATPALSKHRIFVWCSPEVLANQGCLVYARDDDYFFGVLHSRLHEVWSLRMGTSLEDRPRYTPTTTFDTFPFPVTPHPDPAHLPASVLVIAQAAHQLHEERHAWLNPSDAPESVLRKRTLTHLYNALNVFRGQEKVKTTTEAANFAPRLDQLHRSLDEAVCRAYGWEIALLDDKEALLRELLSLNLARARPDQGSR
jgi:hypothetical protein